jgi:diguanylate cyclase (GGDEF)-like protein
MLRKIVIIIYNLLTGAKNPVVYRALFFFLFVSPVIVLALIDYADLDRESTTSILAKRRSLSVLSAAIIDEKLDNLINLGISYTTRPRVIEYVEKGDWKGAISITAHALDLFPSFDRIIFYDPYGVIKADMPHAIPSVIGQSRADREWYNIVKRSWKPHISGVYIRGAEPKMPVVSVIVPIKTLTSSATAGHSTARGEQKVIGILQFQIKLDIFNDWINNLDIGPGSIIYIVDQYGRLVYHPRYIKERIPTDFSSVGIVAKVLRGIGGSEVNYNPVEKEERLAAYEPVFSYGWGVVITQPTGLAFIEKNKRLKNALITHFMIVSLAGAMALLILYSIVIHKRVEEALRESEERYRELSIVDALTQLYNSRYFYNQLRMEIDRADRYEQPLTLLLLDIDNFKAFNDTYGHVEGDQVLSLFGQVVKRCLRKTDSAYRYGGEEFTIILPMTKREDGVVTAERIRAEFKKENFSPVAGEDVHMTVSIGIAQYKPQEDVEAFIRRVDRLMYQAKKNGKDRVYSET